MTTKTKKTYCRICEAHCGIEVTIDEQTEQVVAIKPDKTHPVSQGYACIKANALKDLHDDPDRVNSPMKRTADGWQKISWQQAMSEIGGKVKSLKKKYGPRSLAMYTGNPTYFNFKSILFSQDFMKSLGSPNLFSSHSIDANNKLFVSTQMYGLSMVHPVPDFDHTDLLICLGTNPVVSQMSFLQIPNAIGRLKAIEARGGKVYMVDPRRTETARKVGQHQFIRPGTDVYLLLALLGEVVRRCQYDMEALSQKAEHLEDFLELGQHWSVQQCAALTGMTEQALQTLCDDYIEAPVASLYMSTGINMGPFGSLCYWLIQGISLISGNLDSRGGLIFQEGPFDELKITQLLGIGGESKDHTLVSAYAKVAGCFPCAALPEEITHTSPERIRALFVCAGNPLHSIPGNELDPAMDELELCVSIDIYMNETAQKADYVLPATDMLERSDYPISWTSLQATPYAQYTDALFPPLHERKEEWEIFSLLARACGASPLGMSTCNLLPHVNALLSSLPFTPRITPDHILSLLLRLGGQVSLEELKASPQGRFLKKARPGKFLGHRVPRKGGRVNLMPKAIAEDLNRLEAVADTLSSSTYRLIGQRERRSHNSWMHNAPHIKDHDTNTALMHPDDAEREGLRNGDEVRISNACGESVLLPLKTTTDLMPGVIVAPHGWGHQNTELSRASKLKGANINNVIPGGTANMEPVSGQSIMMAHTVQVTKAKQRDVKQEPLTA